VALDNGTGIEEEGDRHGIVGGDRVAVAALAFGSNYLDSFVGHIRSCSTDVDIAEELLHFVVVVVVVGLGRTALQLLCFPFPSPLRPLQTGDALPSPIVASKASFLSHTIRTQIQHSALALFSHRKFDPIENEHLRQHLSRLLQIQCFPKMMVEGVRLGKNLLACQFQYRLYVDILRQMSLTHL